jgi:hypothetical protein
MSVNQKLEDLFQQWHQYCSVKGIYIPDGFVDEHEWRRLGKKIMVLLKEPNSTEAGWNYQQFIRDKRYLRERSTWPNLIRWTYGLLNGFPTFAEVEERYAEIRMEADCFFRSVYFANISKIAGGATADDTKILQIARETSHLIVKQIEILEPNLVLCCGHVVFQGVKEALESQNIRHARKRSPGGLEYVWWYDLRTMIVHYHHPNAFYPKEMTYTYLINEIRSIT